MIKRLAFIILLFVSVNCFSQSETFHDFSATTILGDSLHFSSFYGKKVMVVNTATECSYTPQYEDLEDLYETYRDSNFVILGFPCNDFGAQEPGADSTILDFCTNIYGIEFQMMSKVSILFGNVAEVYKWLQLASRNGVSNATVTWNFHKFLIDEAGHWVAHYPQQTDPFAPAIVNWIESPSVIQIPTGIDDNSSIQLTMPFIAGDKLSITFNNLMNEKTTVSLYSTAGQLVSEAYNGMLQNGETIYVDAQNLNNQVYFLHVKNGSQTGAFRFAVVK